jgi:hypothetical protein
LGDSLSITPKPPVPKIKPNEGVGVEVGGRVAVKVSVAVAVTVGVTVDVAVWVAVGVAEGKGVSVGVGKGVTTRIAPPKLSMLARTITLIRITVDM